MHRDRRKEKGKEEAEKCAKRRYSMTEISQCRTPEAHYSTNEKKKNAKKVLTASVISLIFHK